MGIVFEDIFHCGTCGFWPDYHFSGFRVYQDLDIIWFRQSPEFFWVRGNVGKKQVCEVVRISKELLV